MPQGFFYDIWIEEHVLGRLPLAQSNHLQNALQQDVDLQLEYQWQAKIIRCLQAYRKRELKQRLNLLQN